MPWTAGYSKEEIPLSAEETISTLHGSPKSARNAKSALIHQLSHTFPQSIKQLHQHLTREMGRDITYQAVHKAVQELKNEGVILKTNEGWQLNTQWIENQGQFIRKTKQRYGEQTNRYDIDLKNSGPQRFEFDNHTDFSVETAKLVANNVLCQHGETAYWIMEYGWWTLKFHFNHLVLLHKLMKSSPRSCHLVQKKTPFGIWAQKQYEKVGGIGIIGKDLGLNDDFLIQGDWILQIHFQPEDRKTIEKYWKKWKNLEDCYKEFGLKKEPKMSIIATLNKNQEMAQYLSTQVEKTIQKETNHDH